MNKEQETLFLSQIYNTLRLITTQGENTIIMGDCLKAIKQYIQFKEKEENINQEEIEKKEE